MIINHHFKLKEQWILYPATWAEIKFDAAFQRMTFCDISLIRDFNGAMVFSSSDGSLRTGFTNDLYPDAPT
ncbi:unnamed protein product [Adineta steineri]|uniref:Uncharacterized protein n=1 Tax=Adineta steineri TaxID=433720 RepID=A0A814IMQ4_9BILA|nr:unnamed protein product [Adineta steineri]